MKDIYFVHREIFESVEKAKKIISHLSSELDSLQYLSFHKDEENVQDKKQEQILFQIDYYTKIVKNSMDNIYSMIDLLKK